MEKTDDILCELEHIVRHLHDPDDFLDLVEHICSIYGKYRTIAGQRAAELREIRTDITGRTPGMPAGISWRHPWNNPLYR